MNIIVNTHHSYNIKRGDATASRRGQSQGKIKEGKKVGISIFTVASPLLYVFLLFFVLVLDFLCFVRFNVRTELKF